MLEIKLNGLDEAVPVEEPADGDFDTPDPAL